MDVCKRMQYLQQMSEYLLQLEPTSMSTHRLVSLYGHLMREIALKNQIHSLGSDSYKLKRCRKCYSMLSVDTIRVKKKFLMNRCPNCGLKKCIKMKTPLKTHYEKCLQTNSH